VVEIEEVIRIETERERDRSDGRHAERERSRPTEVRAPAIENSGPFGIH